MTDDLVSDDVVARRSAVMAPVAVELLRRSVRGATEADLLEYLEPILLAQVDDGLIEASFALVGFVVGTAGALARDARLAGFHPEKWLRDFAATLPATEMDV